MSVVLGSAALVVSGVMVQPATATSEKRATSERSATTALQSRTSWHKPSTRSQQQAGLATTSSVLFYDGFDGPLNQSWWFRRDIAPDWQKSQARFLPENAYTEGGLLHLLARRHCIQDWQTPNHLNVHPGPCGENQLTRYSAGRVDGSFMTPAGSNWEIRMAALLPANGVPGTRAALWGKNNHDYCKNVSSKTLLGEVDLIEWYPDAVNKGDTVTHLSCSGSLAEPEPKRWETKQIKSVPSFDDNLWLEWIAQRRGTQVTYYLGSAAVGYWHIATHDCTSAGFSGGTCMAILDDPFHAIMQTEVFVNSGLGQHPGPNKNAWFPDQHLLIDWVSISLI